MWAFTANGAHTFDDDSWKSMRGGRDEKRIYPHIGLGTGRILLKRKKKIYSRTDLDIVTPSRWLTGLATQAPVLKGKNIHHIFHGIDTEIFKPLDKTSCRRVLGIPGDGNVVFFSCADDLSRSTWKAGQLLFDILYCMDARSSEPVHALVLGKGNIDALGTLKHVKVHHMGFIHGEALLPVLYSAADVLVFPTRAENLSLVLMEANACGTPAVTFDIGGNSDQVEDNVNGFLVPPFDTGTFAGKTLELLDNAGLRENFSRACREKTEGAFSLKIMAAEYYRLFEQVKRA
jgi:glycosyltransferase involved in cell wall biosynthesis